MSSSKIVPDSTNLIVNSPLASPTKIKRHETSDLAFVGRKYWFLAGKVLPLSVVMLVIRIIVDNTTSFNGLYPIGDTGLILTGGIFIIGFMLNGVIADYKEAEKVPGEIAVTLLGIEESLVCIVPHKHKGKLGCNPAAIRRVLLECLNDIFKWMSGGEGQDDDAMFAAVSRLGTAYMVLMFDAAPPVAARYNQELTRLRLVLMRMAVICHSTYLPAGYAIVEIFVLMACLLVLMAKYGSQAVSYSVILGVSIIYFGMLTLIKDVDDPFEYDEIPDDQESSEAAGGSEIDFSCLLDFRRGLRARIADDLVAEAAVAAASAEVPRAYQFVVT